MTVFMDVVKFPKIGKFLEFVKTVKKLNVNDKFIIKGTVKAHGTNTSWIYRKDEGSVVCQSRNRILSHDSDQFGFWTFSQSEKVKIFMCALTSKLEATQEVIVYGEWVGPGIQRDVGVSNLECKKFLIFDVMVDGEFLEFPFWELTNFIDLFPENTHIMSEFWSGGYILDLNNLSKCEDELIELTQKVEDQCPIAEYFDIDGIGEGIVWRYYFEGSVYRFKVKGDKHSVTMKKPAKVFDENKDKTIKAFVDYAVPQGRLLYCLDSYKESNGITEIESKDIGPFVKHVKADVFSEEMSTLKAMGLESKDVQSAIGRRASEWIRNPCCWV